MDKGLITALGLFALGAVLTIGASSFGLMGHYEAKLFVIVGGVLALLVVFATGSKGRNGS